MIADMKVASGGSRDWRTFDVFHPDEIDEKVSAVEKGRRTAENHARKMRALNSFDSDPRDEPRRSIDDVDLIG